LIEGARQRSQASRESQISVQEIISVEAGEPDDPPRRKVVSCWAACFGGSVEASKAKDAKGDGDSDNIARVSFYETSHTKTAL
jgi:hypothetical protein